MILYLQKKIDLSYKNWLDQTLENLMQFELRLLSFFYLICLIRIIYSLMK